MAGAESSAPQSTGTVSETLAFTLRALRYPNYRLFFGGQVVSLTGTWITVTATSWLVYRLTNSAFLLGVVGFASQFPAFLLTPVAGIFIDRWNRHKVIVATQTLSMVQSFLLGGLVLSGRITIPWLIALSVFQGLVNAFDLPGRQAFVATLIEDRRDLGNAIALNSSMFNAARLIGPTVAGAIIAVSSEGWCFVIDGISYLAVIGSLLMMRVRPNATDRTPGTTPFQQLKEGFEYTYSSRPIRAVITLIGLVCLVGVPYTVLIPIFAATVFNGGPHTLGFLMGASGGGALLGALWMASRRTIEGLERLIPAAAATFGAGLMGFAFSRVLWLSLVLMVITSFGFIVQVASSNTLLQTIVHDTKRGRVMAFFLMAYFGTTPFGSLIAGTLSDRIGAPWTLAAGGLCCVLAASWFAMGMTEFERDIALALSGAVRNAEVAENAKSA